MSELKEGRRWIKLSRISLAGALLILGIYLNRSSLNYGYSDFGSPGPGFFPFWIGAFLALASVIWGLIESRNSLQSQIEQDLERVGKFRSARIFLAMATLALLYEPLGYNLSILLFVFLLSSTMAKGSWKVNLIVALVSSFGVYLAFERLLDIPLPNSIIPFLAKYGL